MPILEVSIKDAANLTIDIDNHDPDETTLNRIRCALEASLAAIRYAYT